MGLLWRQSDNTAQVSAYRHTIQFHSHTDDTAQDSAYGHTLQLRSQTDNTAQDSAYRHTLQLHSQIDNTAQDSDTWSSLTVKRTAVHKLYLQTHGIAIQSVSQTAVDRTVPADTSGSCSMSRSAVYKVLVTAVEQGLQFV